MSARRPKGRRNEPVTREKTLAGQVWEPLGMSRALETLGRIMLKPDMKNSYTQVGQCRTRKSKCISARRAYSHKHGN
jgi:hypothetical protein